jgi:hypothetical protein
VSAALVVHGSGNPSRRGGADARERIDLLSRELGVPTGVEARPSTAVPA